MEHPACLELRQLRYEGHLYRKRHGSKVCAPIAAAGRLAALDTQTIEAAEHPTPIFASAEAV